PVDILEKPARLTSNEFYTMKSNVFHTYRILSRFIGDKDIVEWASYHHEKLNGKGYPFRLRANRIPLGSRIMAVADIFTALTEDRPYKKSLSSREAIKILIHLAEKGEIDSQTVKILEKNLKFIDRSRKVSQEKAAKFYREIRNNPLLYE
uniref:HD-GYP domain-containing protein n=1 Tax=Desulfurobacterium sp. TaxID=2004706 RepID=UPI0026214EF4